ncbi:hypothetical protein Mgra_00009780 [Meloidogyne graminicola]|uniref:Uncharacterized protein n=1 Tax=Meloidogyne graminicola TaxID=189291 RepID=A0A8S9Z6Y5_9BILA|nr:hypothetical protein Mgra_00009780 [Meloidogyne graminicola]
MSNWLLLVDNNNGEAISTHINLSETSCTAEKLKIILASSSENRLALLKQIGITPFLVRPSTFAEDLSRSLTLQEFVEQTAKQKAEQVENQIKNEKIEFDLIIACDTMISLDGKLIGKPSDNNDAFNILKSLDGRKHQVRTGICLISGKGNKILFSVETEVEFGENGDKLIWNYINTGEPMNRAGAYAIQGKGAVLVKAIYGSYSNVIGIPLNELIEKIKEIL